jgi:hypothetical protein
MSRLSATPPRLLSEAGAFRTRLLWRRMRDLKTRYNMTLYRMFGAVPRSEQEITISGLKHTLLRNVASQGKLSQTIFPERRIR